jgi:hypothetical protein
MARYSGPGWIEWMGPRFCCVRTTAKVALSGTAKCGDVVETLISD